MDDAGIIKHVNGAAAAMLQTKRDQMLGAKVVDYVHEEQLKEAITAIASGSRGERKTIELERPETAGGGVMRIHVRPCAAKANTAR